MERYNFKNIEEKWQEKWEKNKNFSTKVDKSKKKFYCLEMFHTHQVKFIWVMLEITQLAMF